MEEVLLEINGIEMDMDKDDASKFNVAQKGKVQRSLRAVLKKNSEKIILRLTRENSGAKVELCTSIPTRR